MNPTSATHQELKCLRTHIVDSLIYQLKNDTITEKRASQLSQAVLDQLTDNLTHPQIHQILTKLEADFPDELKELQAAAAVCETAQARRAIDQQILSQITAGNIDSALETIDKFNLK